MVIKGTEYYDAKSKRYVDFPITDVLQMMGRAGRPQFDDSAIAVVMVHEPKKNFYRRFIYEPFPVESSLHEQLTDHLNAEIVGKTITNKSEAIDYLTWTYFFRRLMANPSYYDPTSAMDEEGGGNGAATSSLKAGVPTHSKALIQYIERLMDKCFADLIRCRCIKLKALTDQKNEDGTTPLAIEPLPLGKVASLYYMGHKTVFQFSKTLKGHAEEVRRY